MPTQEVDCHQSHSVIFFDWDDTLLPSSFLSEQGLRLDSDPELLVDLRQQLEELEACVVGVLGLAMQYGDVHVVTNAETGWVQLSAQKFLPGVVSLLSKIKVLSARSTYEPMYPDSPLKWKFCAFQHKLKDLMAKTAVGKNIISFGDSHVEREAVRAVTRGLLNTTTKSVKFAERPSLEQLRRQIELVTNCFHYIHSHQGDLDLQLTISSATSEQTKPQENSSSSNSNSNVSQDESSSVNSESSKVEENESSDSVIADDREILREQQMPMVTA
jgi:hypothetical protein